MNRIISLCNNLVMLEAYTRTQALRRRR